MKAAVLGARRAQLHGARNDGLALVTLVRYAEAVGKPIAVSLTDA